MEGVQMWTSKLGNKYPLAWMHEQDSKTQKELKGLRKERGNDYCADCGRQDTSWASVTHGVFICVTCSDVHRSVGTHITKVKGCTGTYLWGPDEMEMMRAAGNRKADETFGAEKISPDSTKDSKQRYVVDKYHNRAFVSKRPSRRDVESTPTQEETPRRVLANIADRKQNFTEPHSQISRGKVMMQRADLSNTSVVAKGISIPDSIFDELFGDDIQPASEPKSAERTVQANKDLAATKSTDFKDLDAFLNDCLSTF